MILLLIALLINDPDPELQCGVLTDPEQLEVLPIECFDDIDLLLEQNSAAIEAELLRLVKVQPSLFKEITRDRVYISGNRTPHLVPLGAVVWMADQSSHLIPLFISRGVSPDEIRAYYDTTVEDSTEFLKASEAATRKRLKGRLEGQAFQDAVNAEIHAAIDRWAALLLKRLSPRSRKTVLVYYARERPPGISGNYPVFSRKRYESSELEIKEPNQ